MKKFIKDKYNFISFAIALIPSMLLWIFQPTEYVPYWLFATIALLALCFLWLALMAFFHYKDSKNISGLSVIRCMEDIILCHANPEVSLNVIVTIYEISNQYEHIIGYGYVQNIQQNGIIQIVVKKTFLGDSPSNLVKYVSANTGNIIIKTVATMDTINSFNDQKGANIP